MSADRVVHRLLEEPEDDPTGIGPLERYAGPIEFNRDVKDILDHALFLKQECERAGALNPRVIGEFSSSELHRAFLRLACEELDGEARVDLAIKRLRRHMHSIWRS